MQIRTSRRQLLKVLGATGLGLCFPRYVTGGLLTDKAFLLYLPEINAPDKPTLEIFSTLSQIITLHESLDEKCVEKLFRILLQKPSNRFNILKTYEVLRKLLLKGTQKEILHRRIQSGDIGVVEKWFSQHLLTTWYTGIYYTEGRDPVRLFHREALMWQPLKGLVPIPFVENIEFGRWSKHPRESLES